jgi:hypothetical protein
MGELGLLSAHAQHLFGFREGPLREAIRQATSVIGVWGTVTRMAVEEGRPTVIGYAPEDRRHLPKGPHIRCVPLDQLVKRLTSGRVNPGWKLKPTPPPVVSSPKPLPDDAGFLAPLSGRGRQDMPWQGTLAKKPWDYRITAVIPHLETPEPLRACIELLRLQTERPYLMVIDTGSTPPVREELEAMRAEDLEIHYLAAHGYLRSSEAVAVAQDLAMALCRTEFLFCTHADCFLRRRDYLEWLMGRCGAPQSPKSKVQSPKPSETVSQNGAGVRKKGAGNQQSEISTHQSAISPAVGYQMSPRDWLTDQWEGMVSHTATLLHMPTMHRIGASWSLERASEEFGLPRSAFSSWPDTETCLNLVMRKAGIAPLLIGREENYKRQVDENVDHVRSFPGSLVYSPEYHQRARGWMDTALEEAKERAAAWSEAPACRNGAVRPEAGSARRSRAGASRDRPA